ncbi:MAG TPA: NADH-quinone oxidoreductase subunit C [Clostridia bacterium]|nr:NADH-quinone oxidoreductase subunit C [Clostridia bacterium]
MSEETKGNSRPTPAESASQPPAEKSAMEQPVSTPAAPEKVTAPAAPAAAKPAVTPAKPAVPPKPAGPTPQPWETEFTKDLKQRYGSGLREASTYLGQNYLIVDRSVVYDVLKMLREAEQFDYCVDVTAVHYPKREEQFEVVWILYSFARNERIRVKSPVKDGEDVPSVVELWPTANWLEREAFDMFGLNFSGHPDLRRILLPEGWKGYPLRKEYGILQQDQEWVQINIGIESGQ